MQQTTSTRQPSQPGPTLTVAMPFDCHGQTGVGARQQHQVLRGSFNRSQCMMQVEPSRAAGNRLSLRPHRLAQLYTANTRVSTKRVSLEIDHAGAADHRERRLSHESRRSKVCTQHAAAVAPPPHSGDGTQHGTAAHAGTRCRSRGNAMRDAMHLAASLGRERFGGKTRLRAALPRRGPVCHADRHRDSAARTVAASAAAGSQRVYTEAGRPKRAARSGPRSALTTSGRRIRSTCAGRS